MSRFFIFLKIFRNSTRISKESFDKTEKTKGKLSFLIRLNQYVRGFLNIGQNFFIKITSKQVQSTKNLNNHILFYILSKFQPTLHYRRNTERDIMTSKLRVTLEDTRQLQKLSNHVVDVKLGTSNIEALQNYVMA